MDKLSNHSSKLLDQTRQSPDQSRTQIKSTCRQSPGSDSDGSSGEDIFADKHVRRGSTSVSELAMENSDSYKDLMEALKHNEEEERLLHEVLEHRLAEEALLMKLLGKRASKKNDSLQNNTKNLSAIDEEQEPRRSGIPVLWVVLGTLLGLAAVLIGYWSETARGSISASMSHSAHKWKGLSELDFTAPHSEDRLEDTLQKGDPLLDGFEEIPSQAAMPDYPIDFTVFFNGETKEANGRSSTTSEWKNLDHMIHTMCKDLPEVQNFAHEDNATVSYICEPRNGARAFTESGRRIYSFTQLANGTNIFLVPQGLHFVYPLFEVGNVIFPHMKSPTPGKPIRLKQLSQSPRVFQVENFITEEEIKAILEHNADLVKPSEVGFSGWRDDTRTSSTAWDFNSWAARRVRRRAFDLARMEFDNEMADALQVLRYGTDEWYKPHTDWFDGTAYDGHDPLVNNGTNRFATVFVYLTSVEEGGHTVFPLSKTHEGFNGEQIVHPGTEKTPGYIATSDAKWACNTSSTALRSSTMRGGAILFYNQGSDSALDKFSLHGGCPVIKGVKWSANVWLWNRPKPGKEKAKDQRPAPDHHSIQIQFQNKRSEPVNLFWDDGTEDMYFQVQILPGESSPMTTYHGHRFVARSANSNATVFQFTAHDKYKGQQFVAEIV